MELNDFLVHADNCLEPRSEKSILALAPQLRALGENRDFLARYLCQNMDRQDFQRGNFYRGPTIIVARRKSYDVRVVGWMSAAEQDAQERQPHVYFEGETNPVAHTHSFLLTYGYRGPGYVTDLYECEPDELARCRVGESVTLGPVHRERLAEGHMMFYPAFRVAHVQYAPQDYSVSLNLIVHAKARGHQDQYLIDPCRRVLTGVASADAEFSRQALEFARACPGPQTIPLLERIAASHRLQTVRDRAAGILKEVTDGYPESAA